MNKKLKGKMGYIICLLLCIVFFIGSSVFSRNIGALTVINGQSMEPNYHSGNVCYVDVLHHKEIKSIKRGDVVSAMRNDGLMLLKRIIGLPGDTILLKDGHTYINGELLDEPYINEEWYKRTDEVYFSDDLDTIGYILGEDEFFIMGDNRNNSGDSRIDGPYKFSQIKGVIIKTLL